LHGAAEAILGAPDIRQTETVRQCLLRQLLPVALRSEGVQKLTCLRGEKNPSAWLAAHLRVEPAVAEKGVRVRLDGCNPKEALVLLSALTDAYKSSRGTAHDEVREVLMRRALIQQQLILQRAIPAGGLFQIAVQERQLELGVSGPVVIQAPKLVGTTRAGK
jgi:hypothetical protein